MKNPGVKVKETRGSIRKVLCGCKKPEEVVSNFYVGVRDLGRYPDFCVGVRDPWSYSKFLCGCKRLGKISRISMWV